MLSLSLSPSLSLSLVLPLIEVHTAVDTMFGKLSSLNALPVPLLSQVFFCVFSSLFFHVFFVAFFDRSWTVFLAVLGAFLSNFSDILVIFWRSVEFVNFLKIDTPLKRNHTF